MKRSIVLAGLSVGALIVLPSLAQADGVHRHHHHQRYEHRMAYRGASEAGAYGADTGALVGPADRQLITNGPVADTPENRDRYGQPLSHGGRTTAPVGN